MTLDVPVRKNHFDSRSGLCSGEQVVLISPAGCLNGLCRPDGLLHYYSVAVYYQLEMLHIVSRVKMHPATHPPINLNITQQDSPSVWFSTWDFLGCFVLILFFIVKKKRKAFLVNAFLHQIRVSDWVASSPSRVRAVQILSLFSVWSLDVFPRVCRGFRFLYKWRVTAVSETSTLVDITVNSLPYYFWYLLRLRNDIQIFMHNKYDFISAFKWNVNIKQKWIPGVNLTPCVRLSVIWGFSL